MNNQEKYVKEVINGFQLNKGKGSVYCFPPISFADVVVSIIDQFYVRYANTQVFIVVDSYTTRKSILDKIEKERTANSSKEYNVKILSADYIKPAYKYEYKLVITVGINDNAELIAFLTTQAKFMLSILTKNIMDTEFISNIRSFLPSINVTISNVSVRNDSIYSPVEEYRVAVSLSPDDQTMYDKCSEYISTSVSIFGDLSNIEKCKFGDDKLNITSAEFREMIARDNGWSSTLDTSIDWSKQIDEVYNPNVLFERANNFYNITKQRRDLVTDCNEKLEAVLRICEEHKDKTILIVSKRGEFASKITNYINEFSELLCGDYHDAIEDKIAVDDNTGLPILIKSGNKKGQPKIMGSQAISTLNMKRFNDSIIKVLSIKYSSNVKLQIAVDVVIFTSPLVDGIIPFKTRFTDIVFKTTPTLTYKVYCRGTVENKHLNNQKESSLITVIEDNDNFIGYSETNSNDIW